MDIYSGSVQGLYEAIAYKQEEVMEKFYEEFNKVRRQVANAIAKYLKDDCVHKSYEGTWDMLVSYPNYFEDETATSNPDFYQINLHCYVLGPDRHYSWQGKSWREALEKCKRDIDVWTHEVHE